MLPPIKSFKGKAIPLRIVIPDRTVRSRAGVRGMRQPTRPAARVARAGLRVLARTVGADAC